VYRFRNTQLPLH
jgi:hypothetical protein